MSIRSKWIINFSVAAMLFSVLAGCSLLPKEEEALAPPLIKPSKENLQTYEVKKGTIIKEIKSVANFESTDIQYYQYKHAGGRIEKVFVTAGDHVKKGEVLVQLEVDNLDLEVQYKELNLEKAKQALDAAKQNQDQETMKIALLQMKIAQTEYSRALDKLNSKKLVAEKDGEAIFVDSLKAGDNVDSYRVLISVADPSKLHLVYTAASDMSDVKVGMPVLVTHQNKSYQEKVVQTPSSAPITDNPQLQELYKKSLYINLSSVPAQAEIGQSADIEIITQKKEGALIIPRSGLRSYVGRTYVQVLDGESRKEVDVQVGISTATEVEIQKGLTEGQKIILQ